MTRERIERIIDDQIERYGPTDAPEHWYRVVLSETQLRVIECALETLEAGDPESAEENALALAAIRTCPERMSYSPVFQDRIRTIRRELIALGECSDLPKHELDLVLDRWDDFEQEAETAEGCEREVTS